VTESRRLDADPRGGNGEEARGTPRPRRQRSLPRRRSFYGSGLWRGGEETEGGRRGGICRPWISPGKKRTQKFHIPARARLSSRRRPRFARARAVRARPRRNEGRGRAARAKREGGEWPPQPWLPARALVSNKGKWPYWAWPAFFGPYQTRPDLLKASLIAQAPQGSAADFSQTKKNTTCEQTEIRPT
jgi:hypothetical protein